MVTVCTHWKELYAHVKSEHPNVPPISHKFKLLLAIEAEKHTLSPGQIKEMILNFGSVLPLKPKNIPDSWTLKWCKYYLAPRYDNPDSTSEYVVLVPHIRRGALPYILHRTKGGFADARWFHEVVPELEKLIKDPTLGRPFSRKFNEYVNTLFGDKMTPGQVQAINLFFEKFVPGVNGICTTCYKISLPKSGAGERWVCRENEDFEIRLSAAKPNGKPGQRTEYVSHSELNRNGRIIFATWNEKLNTKDFDRNMQQHDTHIPWKVYDFNKFSVSMPICQCQR